MDNESIKIDVLEELREYIVDNDHVFIECRDDLLKTFLEMKDDGYFYEYEKNGQMREVRAILNKFADAYVVDKDILEQDLTFFGGKRVLEKMENLKIPKKR